MINTHHYDGKMISLIQHMNGEIEKASTMSKEAKSKAFHELQNKLKKNVGYTPVAKMTLKKLINFHNLFGRTNGKNPLYDSYNSLHACDLMWLLYEKIVIEKSQDHENLFIIMLEDMMTGMCAQGICTR